VSKSPAKVYIFATNVTSCSSSAKLGATVLCYLTPDTGGNIRFSANPTNADLPRETVVADYCKGASNGFQMLTPASLLDGMDHRIYGFTVDHPDSHFMLPGSPLAFNSNKLYQEEPIADLTWSTIVNYAPNVNGGSIAFLNSTASADYGNMVADRTIIVYWGMPRSPLSASSTVRSYTTDISRLTGLSVPVLSGNQLGFVDGSGRVNALQASGRKIGISTAWNAIATRGFNSAVVVQYTWLPSKAARPFAGGNSLRVNGHVKRPYELVPRIPNNPPFISVNGLIGYYYTLILSNPDCTHCPTIWYTANLYADQLAGLGDTKAASDGTQDTVSGDVSNIYTGSLLRSDSEWITPCSGSASFYAGLVPAPAERVYCFTMSAAQFKNILVIAGSRLGLSMSTNPADYALESFNFDIENWLPWGKQDDPRMGLSLRDLSISLIPQ
jgi:hypothetical protein